MNPDEAIKQKANCKKSSFFSVLYLLKEVEVVLFNV